MQTELWYQLRKKIKDSAFTNSLYGIDANRLRSNQWIAKPHPAHLILGAISLRSTRLTL